ncbi:protein kinase domain-containing protein [Aeromonas veronii]|uniref:protein kinase domain-containing protein n=1 Tax=Aeromonas veronii TaxID=654 RepID=UPI0035B81476
MFLCGNTPHNKLLNANAVTKRKIAMEDIDLYSLEDELKVLMLSTTLKGDTICVAKTSGMAGDVYIFDQGENVVPRYVCIKVPKLIDGISKHDIAKRFVQELENQLDYYHNSFVNWAFDFKVVMGVPVALFRYWGSDLDKVIKSGAASEIEKLSLVYYTCLGLTHCYENGLICHQDLKPGNIFIRDLGNSLREPPNLDVYKFAIVADFGLANAFIKYSYFEGTRPYIAPEQWNKEELSPKTDMFSLGIIIYELLSNGFHPVGIKLADYWPEPLEGNTRKWLRSNEWKAWVRSGCHIKSESENVSEECEIFIQRMLSIVPSERPDVHEVKTFLLEQIKKRCVDSYSQIIAIESQLGSSGKCEPLELFHPHLHNVWTSFKARFGEFSGKGI